jgi:tetratricopeptide (TPR) repeat protein
VFLDTFRNGPEELHLVALNQLAKVAPETMGTNKQFRIMPEIRRAMVSACSDDNRDVRSFAQSVLSSWRWQRTVYESQRIPRHYLAKSADLEALATETLARNREFAEQPRSVESLIAIRSIYDTTESITYMLPVATERTLPIAESADEAKQIVDNYFKSTYEQYRNQTESRWPFWEIVSAETDRQGLYFVVEAKRTDSQRSLKLIYILPRPSMLSTASSLPYYWFDRVNSSVVDARVGRQQVTYKPNKDANIVLGNVARNDIEAFATTCDVFAYFLTHHSQLFIDRKVQETPETLTWSGQLACIRQYSPRFFEQGGGGSSVYGRGGWEFQRIGLACNRQIGKLSVSVEPIEYPIMQLPADVLTPDWATEELKLMGWKPLETLDYFDQRLFPPEYQKAIDAFDANNASESRQILYRRYHIEKALPRSEFMLGLLYDRAGLRDKAIEQMNWAAGRSQNEHDPGTLVDVARWELEVGQYADARKHAESALQLWPKHAQAKEIIRRLDAAEKAE